MEKAALLLRRPNVQFVLAQNKKKGIEGVLSVQHLLSVFAKGLNPDKEQVRKHMRTNLLRLSINTPIDVAIEAIEERTPDGVLVLNRDKSFAGFLSPDDYRSLMKHGGPKIENDGLSTVSSNYLRNRTANSNEGPVVWTHAGSELLIRNRDITVKTNENICWFTFLLNAIKLDCKLLHFDTTLVMNLKWNASPLRMKSSTLLKSSPSIGVSVLQNPCWNIVLQWIDADTPAGKFAEGFALSSEGTIRTKAGKPRELGRYQHDDIHRTH